MVCEPEGVTHVACGVSSEKDESVSDEIWIENIALREAMDKLGQRERDIIRMRFYRGKTQMEIAAEIGISQAQVSRLEKSAIEHIRENM